MKKITIIILALAMVSCGDSQSPEAIRNKLATQKDKQLELNHQINELEKQLRIAEGDEVASGLIPVHVLNIEKQNFSHFIFLNGKVELVEEAQISPEVNGQIRKIHVSEGQVVKRGDLLVSLNTSMVENSISEIKLGLELADKIYQKQKELWEQNIGSELQYLEAKNAKESLVLRQNTLKSQLDMSLIRAPFSGIVDDIFQKEGELASPGRPVLYMVNLKNLKVMADVSETLLPKISKGDMVDILFPTYGMEKRAPIHRIGNLIDANTRTVRVELMLQNTDGLLKPNQIASLRIRDFNADEALVVPSIVVKQDSRGEFLFVIDKNDNDNEIAVKQYVESGFSYDDRTMITKGLSQGQRVIVAGFNQVGNGSLVEVR